MNTYAICVERKEEQEKEDYFLPMPIEEIDRVFTSFSKEEVLEKMCEADSVLDETNPEKLKIKRKLKNHYKEDDYVKIITDEFYLTYPLDDLPLDMAKNDTLARVLYSHLIKLQKRLSTPEQYARLLNALRKNKEVFLDEFEKSSYIDQRIIRSVIAHVFDVKSYLMNENNLSLHKINEKTA